jgi:hypothetical protein
MAIGDKTVRFVNDKPAVKINDIKLKFHTYIYSTNHAKYNFHSKTRSIYAEKRAFSSTHLS